MRRTDLAAAVDRVDRSRASDCLQGVNRQRKGKSVAGNRDRRRGTRSLLRNDQARVLSGGNPVALGSPKPIERPPVAGLIP